MNKQFTVAALMAVLISFVCPMRGWAQEVMIDDVRYSLENGEATVTRCDWTRQGDLVIPFSVSYEGKDYTVTSIGESAFNNCSRLTSIVIPEGVTSIGEYAFYDCRGLTSFVIPESVTSIGGDAFSGCSGLTSIVIPSSVTSIAERAFMYCSSLTSIVIPEGVTSIGECAFYDCSSLTSFVIPEGVTSIDYMAFYGCSGLTSVVIPESVTSIGGDAFSGCSGLTSIVIPSSVTSIGERAFIGCSGLTSIVISEGVATIGGGAFSSCSGLTSVVIPASVTSIEDNPFCYCSSLTAIDVSPDNMNYISVDGVLYTKDMSKLCAIPIGQNVTSFVIPDGVTSIGKLAFGRSSLISVVIPSSVTNIGTSAFFYCSGLTSVVISEGVTSIGEYAFDGCSSLKTICCKAVTPPSAVASSFGNVSSDAVVYVPVGSKAAYEAADGWQALTIEESDFIDVVSSNIDGIYYDLYSNGEATVTGCDRDKQGDLELPASVTYEGVEYLLTGIGDSAFVDCSGLTSAVIPEGVTSIGNAAFWNCSGLTSVVIPDGVTSIGGAAFSWCVGLTSIVIPDGVTSIGNAAFFNCFGLTSVVIPASVTTIGMSSFECCSSLTAIDVSPDNMNYISVNGVLYTKDKSELLAFPGGKEDTSFVIPEGVTSIGILAFRECKGLTSVVIPESVINIGTYAFMGCTNLTDIYFRSVTPPTNNRGMLVCDTATIVHVPAGSKVAYESASEYEGLTIVEDQPSGMLYFGETVSAVPGSPAYIPVSLLNADAITAFQFDLSLPSGVTLRKVQEDDIERYDMSLSDRADTSHVVSVSMLSDTVARVIVYSTGNLSFNGNDSTVLNVGVDVSAAVALGEYALRMENIVLVTPEEQEYLIPSADGLLVVNSMIIPGDANGDGRVTISDVILTVNYLLGDTATEIDLSAADLNGDGRVSLGDVVGIINLILSGEDSSNATARSMSESTATTDDLFSVSLDRGDNRLLFSLDDNTDYTAFQLDVTLPEGVSVSGAQVGPRASGHTVDWRVLSDGKVRVVVYSPVNALLKKVEGALFALQLSASDKLSESFPVSVTDILLATPRGTEYKSRSLSEILSIDDAVEELHAVEPFTISVSEGVLQVHATESARLPLYTVGGTLLRVLDVEVGLNTYEGLPQGVYLLNKHKVLIP